MMVCASLVAMANTYVVAQQLPNVGFNDWEGAGISLHTMSDTRITQRPGNEPTGWNGTSVSLNGLAGTDQEKIRVKQVTEGDNSYVHLENGFVGCTNNFQPWNALISLGEIWASYHYGEKVGIIYDIYNWDECKAASKFAQQGTYGGVDFTYRPDAIKGRFKKEQNAGEEAFHLVAYSWTGTAYGNVPGNLGFTSSGSVFNKKYTGKVESWYNMQDCDRSFLGATDPISGPNGEAYTAKMIAACDYYESGTFDWKEIFVPLTYSDVNTKPEKMNVIVSCGNPRNTQDAKNGNSLYVDDLDYVYYSRLENVSFYGEAVVGFDSNVYEYDMTAYEYPTLEDVKYKLLGETFDKTVNVWGNWQTGEGFFEVANVGKDIDGATSHTYVFTFSNTTSGVDTLAGLNTKIVGNATGVAISNYTGKAAAYSVDGKCIKAISVDGSAQIELPAGLYIIRTDNKSAKILVK